MLRNVVSKRFLCARLNCIAHVQGKKCPMCQQGPAAYIPQAEAQAESGLEKGRTLTAATEAEAEEANKGKNQGLLRLLYFVGDGDATCWWRA